MFWLSLKALSEALVLGRNPDRTRIVVALAHHHAAESYKYGCGKAELLRAQKGSYDHIPARLQLPVNLHAYFVAQSVQAQSLLDFRQAELPRQSRVLYAGKRRSPSAAIVAAY